MNVLPQQREISHENSGPTLLCVCSPVMVLVTVVFALRCWIRANRGIKFGLDDWCLVASFFLIWAHFTVITLQVVYGGLGTPLVVSYIKDPKIPARFMKLLFVQELVSPITLTCIKCGILAMYWRLFPTRFTRRGCIVLAVILAIWCIAIIVPSILQCRTVSDAWNLNQFGKNCNRKIEAWISWQDGIPEIATTVIIFVMPIYEVSRIHASLRTRVAVSAVFLMASLTVVTSVMRFVFALQTQTQKQEDATGGTDRTVRIAKVLLVVQLEFCSAFLAACLPALRPVGLMIKNQLACLRHPKARRPLSDDVTGNGGARRLLAGNINFSRPRTCQASTRRGLTTGQGSFEQESPKLQVEHVNGHGLDQESRVAAAEKGSLNSVRSVFVPGSSIEVRTEIQQRREELRLGPEARPT